MAFTVTVTRGYTMVAGVKPSVDDWNAGFLPSITVSGAVGSSDIADDAITLAKLNPNILLGASLLSSLELADRLLIGDSSVGDNAVATFQTAIQSLFTVGGYPTAIPDYPTNLMLFYNVATAAPFAMNIERWLSKTHEQLTELTTTEHDDTLIVRDVSEAEGVQVRKVSLRNVLPDVIAAQTVNNPSQIVVNSKGQITSLSNSAGSTDIVAWMRDTGPSTTAAQSINATTETVLRLTDTTTVTWLSLASNVFTVAAGTYEIDAVVPWYVSSSTVNPVTVLLYDETASTVLATSSDQQGTDDDQGWIPLKAVFTVAVETQLSLRIFSTIAITIGDPVGNGYDETFTQVLLRRLGA